MIMKTEVLEKIQEDQKRKDILKDIKNKRKNKKTTEKKSSGLNIFGLPSSNIGLYYFTNPLFCRSGLMSGVLPVKSLNA